MSVGLRRGLMDLACRALQATLPFSLQSWGWAVRYEAATIRDDTKALLFTLDSLCGLIPRAVASRLLQTFASLIGDGAEFSEGSPTMNIFDAAIRRPRARRRLYGNRWRADALYWDQRRRTGYWLDDAGVARAYCSGGSAMDGRCDHRDGGRDARPC